MCTFYLLKKKIACVVPEVKMYNIWTLYSSHMRIHAQTM